MNEYVFKKELKKMINIAICDDNIPYTGQIEAMLQTVSKTKHIDMDINVFWNGGDLLKTMEGGYRFDIICLDIEMEGEDGITIAKRIRSFDQNVLIVYVTNYELYMKESFSVRPFRFLVKPISLSELEECIGSAYDDVCMDDFYYRFRYQKENYKIPLRDILYFESVKRKVYIITIKNKYEYYGKLNDIEENLKNGKIKFLRIHQSYLVNYRHIEALSYQYVRLDNGEQFPISEERSKRISEQYCVMENQ